MVGLSCLWTERLVAVVVTLHCIHRIETACITMLTNVSYLVLL